MSQAYNRPLFRKQVRFFYDVQRVRLQTGGRVTRAKPSDEEVPPEVIDGDDKTPPIELTEEDWAYLEKRHAELNKVEKDLLKDIEGVLKKIPFYRDTLSDKSRYKGLGPTMAAVIFSEFDINKADTPSKMWKFAGLAPTDCRRCKDCHAILGAQFEDEGVNVFPHPKNIKGVKCKHANESIPAFLTYASAKTMKPTKGQKLPYNAFLRTKLIGVLGPCLIKANSPWRKVYDDYKHRLESKGWGMSDGHRHQASIRYMVKMLLLDVWKGWRESEKLPIRPSYHEEKLGHVHAAA